jgi:ATP-dependent Clp protease ATP-binding subunit ClpX
MTKTIYYNTLFPKDIKDFGLIQIIGRLPVLTHMDPLDRATLRSILTEPKMR